jgi:hypothetical protein
LQGTPRDDMAKLIKVADSFMNIRGSFKIGPLDVGSQASLVKRKSGKWLLLDAGADDFSKNVNRLQCKQLMTGPHDYHDTSDQRRSSLQCS